MRNSRKDQRPRWSVQEDAMGEYSGRRLLLALPTLLLVTFTTFLAFHLVPYDPSASLLNSNSTALASDQLRQELGLNGSIWNQYATWLGQVLHFNLGLSYVTLEPVSNLIGPRLVPTLVLDGTALLFALAISLLIRVFSSANRNIIGAIVRVGAAIPSFVLGLVLLYIFAIRMQRLPVGGYQPLTSNFPVGFSHLILPAVTLGLAGACITLSQVRSRLFPRLREEDLSPDLLLRSGFRSREAILNELPLVGLQAGVILAGTFVIEPLFGWPGIGSLALDALSQRDYPTAQGIVLLVAIAYLLISVFISQAAGLVGQGSAAEVGLYPLSGGQNSRREADAGSFLTLSSDSAASGIDAPRSIPAWVPAAVLGVIVAAAVLFPLFYEHIGPNILVGITDTTLIGPESYHSPTHEELLNLDAPFSALHPLGTDALGRDVLARVVYGARAALGIGALSAAVAAVIGLLLGLLGSSAAWLVDIIMNTLLAFPAPLLALAVLVEVQPSITSLAITLAVVQVPIFIRYARELAHVRAQTDPQDFGGLVTGLSSSPNLLLAPVAGAMAFAILWESMLSFLGLGLPAPTPDWGDMVASAAGRVFISPVELVGPSVAIVLTLLTLALVADNALQSSMNEE
jgi:peptide/nickel transport system permease protein